MRYGRDSDFLSTSAQESVLEIGRFHARKRRSDLTILQHAGRLRPLNLSRDSAGMLVVTPSSVHFGEGQACEMKSSERRFVSSVGQDAQRTHVLVSSRAAACIRVWNMVHRHACLAREASSMQHFLRYTVHSTHLYLLRSTNEQLHVISLVHPYTRKQSGLHTEVPNLCESSPM